ncbi:hypothetical protein [Mycobacteroides abscessus]|uniref:hypothetical protein n=1 Tax=Mycobacteroides abscessus TaxID=36809 RepID=UPI0019D252E8|nr:hypothetical protein [Mycobacteroides abscessus]MBN7457365.1 hypothetical protein [Mycobacteroides abscessus subsp. abscessus]
MFPFARAAESYSALAAEADSLAGELSSVLGQFDGMSGLPIDAHADRIQHTAAYTGELALSMQETSAACQAQDTFDLELTQAPTPDEVAQAKNHAVRTYVQYHQGSVTLAEAVAAQREADQLQEQRDAAVEQHAQCTAGTLFDVPSDGGWQPDGSGEGGTEGDDDEFDRDSEREGGESANTGEDPEAKPQEDTGLRRLPLMEPSPVPVIPITPEPEPEAVGGGTDLSSTTTATPSAQGIVSPTGTYTPAPSVPTVQNQPTAPSPQWMQPTTPAPTQQQAQRPYAASPQSKQREQSREERAAEKWLAGDTGAAVAAVSTTHSVTSAPSTPTSAPTASAPSAPSATPAPTATTPSGAPTPTQAAAAGGPVGGPVGGGMAPGTAGAGHGQAKTAPKIASADSALQQAFEEAMKQRPYEEPVRDGLLGPIVNPRAEAGR